MQQFLRYDDKIGACMTSNPLRGHQAVVFEHANNPLNRSVFERQRAMFLDSVVCITVYNVRHVLAPEMSTWPSLAGGGKGGRA